jgi:hypothetical protein
MIGDRQGGHAERDRPLHEAVDPGCPVQQAVIGVVVEVNECHGIPLGHSHSIVPGGLDVTS